MTQVMTKYILSVLVQFFYGEHNDRNLLLVELSPSEVRLKKIERFTPRFCKQLHSKIMITKEL